MPSRLSPVRDLHRAGADGPDPRGPLLSSERQTVNEEYTGAEKSHPLPMLVHLANDDHCDHCGTMDNLPIAIHPIRDAVAFALSFSVGFEIGLIPTISGEQLGG